MTLELRVRPPPAGRRASARPTGSRRRAAGQPVDLVFFRTFGDEIAAPLPEGGTALVHGRLGRFRRPLADHPPGPARPGRGQRASAAVYPADRGPEPGPPPAGDRGGAGPPAGAAGVAGVGPRGRAALAILDRGARVSRTRPRRRPSWSRTRRRGSGWPTTSCWPGSWRSPSCDSGATGPPGRSLAGDGSLRPACSPPCPTRLTACQERAAGEIGPTWRRRPRCCGCSRATSAAARRWWRSRHAAGGRGRLPSGADGADRGAGAAARGDPRQAAAAARARRRAVDRLRAGGAAATRAGADRGRAGAIVVGTHALFQAERHLPRPRARGGRRAAPLRRGISAWPSWRRARRPTSC